MQKSFRRAFLAILLFVAMFAALPYNVLADHSWGSYHWARTSNPFNLKLGDNVTSCW